MKHFYFIFLSLFVVGTLVSSVEYHGNRTHWTTVDNDGRTYVALHVLEESVNIIFPKDKKFADIASDMKLYSPTGNGKCQDLTNTLEFKLAFANETYIRGAIKVVVLNKEENVKMFMYEKCGRDENADDYATQIIEDTESELEDRGRTCFKTGDPFNSYGPQTTKNVMELQSTPNNFGCHVFLILPEYMHVEDFPLPTYDTVTPLNASFDGHDEKFWWKSANDSMLPSAVSFDSSKDTIINILNSTKDNPYFFRIGSGQPIPVLKLNFGEKCNGTQFEMALNLKPECLVLFEKKDEGFMVSTKTSPYNHFKGLLSSMIFGDEHVFVKVNTPLNIKALKVCNFSNTADVPIDQFVLQVALLEGNVDGCEKAEIVLVNSNGTNGTEVLIDRSKIVETRNDTNLNSTQLSSTSKTDPSESAGFEWYWYLIIGLLIVGILAGIIVCFFCIRRRRQKAKKSKIPVESVEDEEVGRRTITTKTAISPEKVPKEMKPKGPDGKKNEKKMEKRAKKEAKGNDKPLKDQKVQPAKIQSVQPPEKNPPPPIQPSQEKPVQPPAAPKPPTLPPIPIVPAKPLRNLKHRSMYGEDKRTELEEPFDYHENEGSEFRPTKTPAEFPRPDLRVHDNFWDCLTGILQTTMFCKVFADNFFNGNTNVYFMFRDLVAESEKYAPLRILSNRILEQYEDHPTKSLPPFMGKDEKKRIKTDWCYCMRVFVLSYDPITVEIHCRGPWPHFMFEIFKCDKCGNLLEQLLKNEWKNSPVACNESFDQFVCRVKRTPINSHQFLCYYGGPGSAEPDNPNDVHNIFIFRGEWNSDNLRACTRGCSIADDKSHFNECELETSLQKSPSLSI